MLPSIAQPESESEAQPDLGTGISDVLSKIDPLYYCRCVPNLYFEAKLTIAVDGKLYGFVAKRFTKTSAFMHVSVDALEFLLRDARMGSKKFRWRLQAVPDLERSDRSLLSLFLPRFYERSIPKNRHEAKIVILVDGKLRTFISKRHSKASAYSTAAADALEFIFGEKRFERSSNRFGMKA